MVLKTYISADDFLKLSYIMARRVEQQLAQTPNYVVGIWRGGAIPGIAAHEYLERTTGLDIGHFPIQSSMYKKNGQQAATVRVKGIPLFNQVRAGERILLVDEVWDSGRSIDAINKKIASRNVKVNTAVVFYKPKKNQMPNQPDVYVLENNSWLVFPHELEGVPVEDLPLKERSYLGDILLKEDVIESPLSKLEEKLQAVTALGKWWFLH